MSAFSNNQKLGVVLDKVKKTVKQHELDYLKTERKPGHKRTRFDVPQEYTPGIISAHDITSKHLNKIPTESLTAHGNDSELPMNNTIMNITAQSKMHQMHTLDRISENVSSIAYQEKPKLANLKFK